MVLRCRLCDDTFQEHLVVAARCEVHWRGKSFDSEEVVGQVGLALMDALGWDSRDPGAMDRFLEAVHIEGFREDPMGVEPWQGEKEVEEGEDWEFHVGLREALDGTEREAAAQAAVGAVGDHRSFHDAKLLRDHASVEDVAEDEDEGGEEGDGGSRSTWRNPALDEG